MIRFLPNTNGVVPQSPGLIVQSQSEAEARNDLPRDQAPKFTTPTWVAPHSEPCEAFEETWQGGGPSPFYHSTQGSSMTAVL